MGKYIVITGGKLWYEFDSKGVGIRYVDIQTFVEGAVIVLGLLINVILWSRIFTGKF